MFTFRLYFYKRFEVNITKYSYLWSKLYKDTRIELGGPDS